MNYNMNISHIEVLCMQAYMYTVIADIQHFNRDVTKRPKSHAQVG
jgi:hypothetical protein